MYRFTHKQFIEHIFLFVTSLLFLQTAIVYADDSDFETEGYIQSIGADSLVVNGFIFDVDSETEVKAKETDYVIFSDLAAGDFVEIEGTSKGNGRFYAEKIELDDKINDDDDDGDKDNELETEGYISNIDSNSVEVNGYTFLVNAETRIKGSHGIQISFDQLKEGMNVEIEGYFSNDGFLTAHKIEVEEGDFDNELEFYGIIDSVLTDAIVINQKHFQITNETLIELRHKQLGTIDDLFAGLFVEVKAAHLADGSFLALRIKIENDDENEIEIVGVIDSIGFDFIEVLDYRVDVDENTRIKKHNNDSLTLADLEVGQRVKVHGSLVSDGIIKARKIKIRRFHDDEIEFTGQITFLSTDQVQVEQTLFNVDSATVIFDNNRNPIALDQLSVGQFVEIKGRLNPDGSFYAVRIKIEDRGQDEIEFTGLIDVLTADSITVNGFAFYVDKTTMVLDLQNNPISFTDLNVGDLVEIKGVVLDDGSYRAVKIKLEDTPGLIVVSGDITGRSANQIWINGPQYQINEKSVILNEDYLETTMDSFSSGSKVTVWAMTANGNNTVLQVKLDKSNAVTSLEEQRTNLPEVVELYANYPNPFNPETNISFAINQDGFKNVQLEVYDIIGRKVRTLFNGLLDRGRYSFKWNGINDLNVNVASGLYFYKLKTANAIQTRKMTLIR